MKEDAITKKELLNVVEHLLLNDDISPHEYIFLRRFVIEAFSEEPLTDSP